MVVVRCRLNQKKVNAVAKEMGLKRPVKSYREDLEDGIGHYDWNVPKSKPHEIAVTSDAPTLVCPYAMTRTILHELKHAEQYERLGEMEFKIQYQLATTKALKGVELKDYDKDDYREKHRKWIDAYNSNPFEGEAEEWARDNADKYPHLAELYG